MNGKNILIIGTMQKLVKPNMCIYITLIKNYSMDKLYETIFNEIRKLKINPKSIEKIKESVIKLDNSLKIKGGVPTTVLLLRLVRSILYSGSKALKSLISAVGSKTH